MANEKELEYLGVLNWHRKGFKGRNVLIASRENVLNVFSSPIEAYEFEKRATDFAKHGTNVMDYILQVAPEARHLTFEFKGSVGEIFTSPYSKYIIDVIPDILTTSLFGSEHRGEPLKFYTELYNNGCFLVCAAGNDGLGGVRKLAEGDMWKAIGSCRYNNGEIKRASYSSVGKELDFMSFDNLRANWSGNKNEGTSFASPLFAGMIALVQSFFIEKSGHKLNHSELMNFIKDNCKDLEEKGKDNKSGYGLFILPDPDSIDISKYTHIIDIEEVFNYLQEEKELLEPHYWKEKILEEDKFKWMFIKWANAIRFARGKEKNPNEIYDYNIKPVISWLHSNGYLYEPNYWTDKIAKEPKLRWLFYKWYNAIRRVK